MILSITRKTGYLTAIIGSLMGAFLLLNIGGSLGMRYVENFMPNAEIEAMIPPLLGQFIGWWLGEVLGCWLALRWRNVKDAKKTAIILMILTPVGIIIWAVFYLVLFNWSNEHLSSLQLQKLHHQFRPISVGVTIIALALIAKLLTKPTPTNKYQPGNK